MEFKPIHVMVPKTVFIVELDDSAILFFTLLYEQKRKIESPVHVPGFLLLASHTHEQQILHRISCFELNFE